ncbi:hypothetical protein PENANT_c024G04261 [Penicillium antarcticum]|uniref:Alcohol dehydrogenase-like C-terminal domain-containing protein n=1 Tax=Penicillium antarcticum TaxID=416450 RepID=A0A1V6PYZ7_9EURO|nr:hypothetical protein PENANT_c024G04261 [Penicillium antarcticum]
MPKGQIMRAAVFQGVGKIGVEDRPRPQIQDDNDVILKVRLPSRHCEVTAAIVIDVKTAAARKASCLEIAQEPHKSMADKPNMFPYVRVPQPDSLLIHAPPSNPPNLLVLMTDIFATGYFCAKPLLLNEDPGAAIKAATDRCGADILLEVVGTLDAMRLCVDIVRPFGSISSVGVQTETVALEGPVLYGKNVTIAWGHCPVRGIFEEALATLDKVQDKVSFLCDRSIKLEEAEEACWLFNDRKAHKVLLVRTQ